MGEDPSTIRAEVEQTRERMGDTVEALAYKADVKTRAKENVSGKVDSVKSVFTGAKESVSGSVGNAAGTVGDATPSAGDVKQAARQGAGMAKENPLGLAIGAVAVGFIAGLLVPSTSIENEKIGPMADQVKEQVKETAQVAVDQAQAATQAVKETGQEHAQEAKSDLQDQAQQAAQQVRS